MESTTQRTHCRKASEIIDRCTGRGDDGFLPVRLGWRKRPDDAARAVDDRPAAVRAKSGGNIRRAAALGTVAGHEEQHVRHATPQLRQLGRMRRAFRRALGRDDHLWYAHFELAVAEAATGRRRSALALLEQARLLDPRETTIRTVRSLVLARKPVDRAAIDRLFLERVRGRIGR